MPKSNWWADLVDEEIEKAKQAADAYIKEFIEPIADIGNPEKVIGKPYEQWTDNDKRRAGQLYSTNPEALNRFIFNKEYEILKELEA